MALLRFLLHATLLNAVIAEECTVESCSKADAAESSTLSLLQVSMSVKPSDTTSDLDAWYARKDEFLESKEIHLGGEKGEVTAYRTNLNGLQHTAGLHEGGARGHDRGEMRAMLDSLAHDSSIQTVCETGFNAGDSALRFLAQSNKTLYEFDLGRYDYSKVAAEFMQLHFPDRFHITWGDSTKSLPDFHKANPDVKCDLVIVDGGHSYDVALADLVNFKSMAADKHVLYLDDSPCLKEYCIGVNQAWGKVMAEGCVVEDKVYAENEWYGFRKGAYHNFNCTL